MNEDEAFIRTIVDSPGDDLPRLVYADWLDDRDDPRGPYLRAEHEWAKPWRDGMRPTDSPELREMAKGLDPVWVARVSRPPVGVCCEHLQFEEHGPQLTDRDLDEVRRWRRVRLPDDYTAFLLNYNGGIPRFSGFYLRQGNAVMPTGGRFFALHPNGGLRDRGTLHCEVNRYWNEWLPPFLDKRPPDIEDEHVAWYHDFIPVAEVVEYPRQTLMLGVYGEDRGQLQYIRWDWSPGSFSDQESAKLGGSFAGLLGLIAPDMNG